MLKNLIVGKCTLEALNEQKFKLVSALSVSLSALKFPPTPHPGRSDSPSFLTARWGRWHSALTFLAVWRW